MTFPLLGAETVEVTRWDFMGFDQAGHVVISPAETFQIRASVQPLSRRELELLPESARRWARFNMFVPARERILQLTGSDPDKVSDSVSWHGRTFILHGEEDWTGHQTGLPHRVYMLMERGHDE